MKLSIIILFIFIFSQNLFSQDLSNKISNNAFSVLRINGNRILNDITLSDVNNSYVFQYILKKNFNSNIGVDLIEDFGIDFTKDFYLVEENSDDYFITYYLYSLKDPKVFENVVSKDAEKIEKTGNIKYANYGNKKRLAWNDSFVLFIDIQTLRYNYFKNDYNDEFYKLDSIQFPEDYDIYPKSNYNYYNEENTTYTESIEVIEEVLEVENPEQQKKDSIKYIEELIEKDKLNKRSNAKSIRRKEYNKKKKKELLDKQNQEIRQFIDEKMENLFSDNNFKSIDVKKLNINDDAVASLYLKSINDFKYVFKGYRYGFVNRSLFSGLLQTLSFSEQINLNLFFNEDNIVLKSYIETPDVLKESIKKINNTKLNKKFIKYIPEHALAYTTMSINTEAYVDEYPKIIEYMVSKIDTSYSEEAKVFADIFDVFFDAKEISELFTGDGVLIWNGLRYKKVEHVMYKYNEDTFEYTTEVELRDELLPDFTFMFGSKKDEIILKLFKLLVKHNLVRPYKDYYYFSHEDYRELPFNIYVAHKDNIVFVTSDDQQINDIQNGRVADPLSKSKQKYIKKYPFFIHLDLEQIFNDIPLKDLSKKEMEYVLFGRNNLKQIITYNYLKDNNIFSNAIMTIPSTERNATKYILKIASEFLLIDKRF